MQVVPASILCPCLRCVSPLFSCERHVMRQALPPCRMGVLHVEVWKLMHYHISLEVWQLMHRHTPSSFPPAGLLKRLHWCMQRLAMRPAPSQKRSWPSASSTGQAQAPSPARRRPPRAKPTLAPASAGPCVPLFLEDPRLNEMITPTAPATLGTLRWELCLRRRCANPQ